MSVINCFYDNTTITAFHTDAEERNAGAPTLLLHDATSLREYKNSTKRSLYHSNGQII